MDKQISDAYKILMTCPEGQTILQDLQGHFLYPDGGKLEKLYGDTFTKEEQLAHHRVVLYIMAMMGQE